MEIDNLTRLIDYACYASEIIKEDALCSKQEALTNGTSVGDLKIKELDREISYYEKIQEAFSSVAQQLMKDQKTSDKSRDNCAMIVYFCNDPLSNVQHFCTGVFTLAAEEYEKRYDEERGFHSQFEKDVELRGKLFDLQCFFEVAGSCCEGAIDRASKLIEKSEEGRGTVDDDVPELENDVHCFRELRNTFSFIEQQLEEEDIATKESYDKCTEIERICNENLSDTQYFNIDLFLLAADEYKRTFDKERLGENRLPINKNKGKIAKFLILGIVLLWLGSDYRWNPPAAYKGSCKYLTGTWNYEILEGCELQFHDDYTFTYRGPVFGSQLRFTSGVGVFLIGDNADYDDKSLSLKDYEEQLNGDSFTVEGTYQVRSKPLFAGVHSPFEIELKWNRIDGKYRAVSEKPWRTTEFSGFVLPRKNVLILDQDLDCRELWYVKDSDLPNYLKPKKTSGVPSL